MKTDIFALVCLASLAYGLWYAITTAAVMPNVYFDYHTNECVKVDNFGDTDYTCENLPKRFHHSWATQ